MGPHEIAGRRGRPTCLTFALAVPAAAPAAAQQPSYDCAKATHEIEQLACRDKALSALDLQLAEVYKAAEKKAVNEQPPTLTAEQRGWVKGRKDCWKDPDQRGCATTAYVRRIAELQARYRLVAPTATVSYCCDGNGSNEVIAIHFPTAPATAIVERGDQTSLMYAEPMASGTKYVGRNESLAEHQGEVTVVWGHGAAAMRCRKADRRRFPAVRAARGRQSAETGHAEPGRWRHEDAFAAASRPAEDGSVTFGCDGHPPKASTWEPNRTRRPGRAAHSSG